MSIAYRYQDNKSDKFWWAEQLDNEMVVNFGKTGSIGRYQLKEFDDEQSCRIALEKLVASKIKSGYQVDTSFDFNQHIYLDDVEMGISPLTSHPAFRKHFSDDFYYCCADEEAPFGSDEGHDTLGEISEQIRKSKSKTLDFSTLVKYLNESVWGIAYLPVESLDLEDVRELYTAKPIEMVQSDMSAYACAFAQIKMTGKLNSQLKQQGILGLKRYMMIGQFHNQPDISPIAEQMLRELEAFPAGN
ncbi:WGR domain-containing protein [Pseudomonas sp. F1_0610]|uniref:WGR domain-containing protein n=1 Tax=Pseudomonas sp. F1_0610 TaxID=3114284 RepID=UPI0039C3BEE6